MNLKERIVRIDELKEQIKTLYNSNLEDLLIDFANLEKPLMVLVEGYTPYFNDGDPCIHSVSYSINFKDLNDFYYDLDDIEELEEFPDIFSKVDTNLKEEFLKINEMYFSGKEDSLIGKAEGLFYEKFAKVEDLDIIVEKLIIPILEDKYETNFRVCIYCNNNEVSILDEQYIDHD